MQGMDVNKKDKFGRTPLYYFLATFNNNYCPEQLQTLFLSGAKLTIPLGDAYFHHFQSEIFIVSKINIALFAMAAWPNIDYSDGDMYVHLKRLVAKLLQNDVEKWSVFIMILIDGDGLRTYSCYNDYSTSEFKYVLYYLYNIFEDICSDLGNKCEMLLDVSRKKHLLKNILNSVVVLKFFLLKGVDMEETSIEAPDNFLDFAIRFGFLKAVEFLVSIGVRPKNTFNLLTDLSSLINLQIRQIVNDTRFQLSLKNMCRLRINKSLNVNEAAKLVPSKVEKFIKFENEKDLC